MLIETEPDAFREVCADYIEQLAEEHGAEAACEFASTMLNELVRVANLEGHDEVAGDINVDDFKVVRKYGKDGEVTEKKIPLKGNIKQLVRSFRT